MKTQRVLDSSVSRVITFEEVKLLRGQNFCQIESETVCFRFGNETDIDPVQYLQLTQKSEWDLHSGEKVVAVRAGQRCNPNW